MQETSVAALQRLAVDAERLQDFFLTYADKLHDVRIELPNLKLRQRTLKDEIAACEAAYVTEVSIRAKTPEGQREGLGNEKARGAAVQKMMARDAAAQQLSKELDAIECEIRKLETAADHLEEDFKARQFALTAVTKQIDIHVTAIKMIAKLQSSASQ